MTPEKQTILGKLAPHQVDALKRGGSTVFEGETYTGEDFGFSTTLDGALAIDANVELAKARDLNVQLAAENEQLKAHIDGLSAADPSEPFAHAELLDSLIPKSESGLKNLSKEKVKAIAEYKGIDVDGKDEAALIAELTKKPEAQ